MGFLGTNSKKEIVNEALSPKIGLVDNYAEVITQLELIKSRGNSIFPKYVQDLTDIISTKEQLEKYKEAIIKNGIYACDTETTGLFWYVHKLVGVSLYTPNQKAVYIPLIHQELGASTILPNQLTYADIKEFFKDLNRKSKTTEIKSIFHNAYFDMCFLMVHLGVLVKPYWDTMLAKKIQNELEPAGLKYLYNVEVMGREESATSFTDVAGVVPFNFIPIEYAKNYAAFDAYMTYEVFKYQQKYYQDEDNPKAAGHYNILMGIEMPFLPVVAKAALRGFYVDKKRAKELEIKYQAKLEETRKELDEMVIPYHKAIMEYNSTALPINRIKMPIDWGSPKQMVLLLFTIIKLPPPANIPPGMPLSTRKEYLQDYKEPIVKKLLKYKHYITLLSTFIRKSVCCLGTVNKDGHDRLFTTFKAIGAPTGRMSSGDKIGLPNVQNYPAKGEEAEIKSIVIAPPGKKFISGDFSQIEPKFLADLSKDPALLEIYYSGKQLYSSVAAKTFNLPYDECLETLPANYDIKKLMHPETISTNIDGTFNYKFGSKNRKSLKAVVMGMMFSRGAKAIASELDIKVGEAQKIIDDFYKTFNVFYRWKLDLATEVKQKGYLTTAYGRTRHFPLTYSTPTYEFFKDQEPLSLAQARQYMEMLSSCRYPAQKKRILAEIEGKGITVIDNTMKIYLEEKQFVNLKISGSAADTLKLTAIAVDEGLHSSAVSEDGEFDPNSDGIINFIHDELWLTVEEDKVKEVFPKFKYLMENATQFVHSEQGLKMASDIKVTDIWE